MSTPTIGTPGDALSRTLRRIVGEHNVVDDPAVRAQYEQDWTGRFSGPARLVVRPGSPGEVARVMEACAAAGAAVIPQGGNTGLVGGGIPRNGEVVINLTRLTRTGAVDPATRQVEVEAGVTLRGLQQHAAASDLDAGMDLAARDAATVGGLVACDAGGLRALRYGTARARVAGLEAVLADGSVIGPGPAVVKNNAGYSLESLLIGSEGSLGIITRVRWQLVPVLRVRVSALVPLDGLGAAVSLLAKLRPLLPSLDAAEFITDAGMQVVLQHLQVPPPVSSRPPAYALLECAADCDPTEDLFGALEQAAVEDAVVATDSTDRARLWRFREEQSEAISRLGTPHKFDVGVPLRRLPEFTARVSDAVEDVARDAQLVLFGHLADGNVHVNVIAEGASHERLAEAVFRTAAACGGTISAEHGIGVEKTRWLHLVRNPPELATMAALKRALDPDGLLNPGVAAPMPGHERP